MRYLALGDSYTIGTGASSEARNYPSIIAARITEATATQVELTNPSVNGFTSDDLIEQELVYVTRLKPDLVSILIGVNDLVQGRAPDHYGKSLARIYDAAGALGLEGGLIAAISIPNWSVVPAAAAFGNPEGIRALTEIFNSIAQQAAKSRGFTWVDITAVSTSGLGSRGWISSDGLHPGDVQYAAWADVIWEAVSEPWTAAVPRL
jgi:acyl-CoA thioesterase-1